MRIPALLALASVCPAEEVKLSRASLRPPLHRSYAVEKAAPKPQARQARIGSGTYVFVDVDGHGKFDDLGVDGWLPKGARYILPLERTVVLGTDLVLWEVAGDGSKLRYQTDPLPLSEGQREGLLELNSWRMRNGFPPVSVDADLSRACAKHCDYMAKHGITHVQKPEHPEYTPEGAVAAKSSCLASERPALGVWMFYASFYHRLPLMLPGTRKVGIGVSSGHVAVDAVGARKPRKWTYPIVVPAPDSEGHPTHFSREQPNPVPRDVTPGFQITLTWKEGRIAWPIVKLRLKNAKGEEIPVAVSSPDRPANVQRPRNRDSICIIPRGPLKPNTTYWIQVSYKLDGGRQTLAWKFTTGHSRRKR